MSLVGTRVGHIRLESELGRGGMGEVYRGFDETLERVVAVKTIRAEHRLSGSARARFLREARILSKLADPAICLVYDLIEADEADLLVLEFVEGETLDRLRLEGALDQRRILEIGTKIAAALAVAHRERIIHRDLKPQNIMVTPAGVVKVLDFGIARSTTDAVGAAAASDEDELRTRELAAADPERTIAFADPRGDSTGFSGALTQFGSIVGTVQYMSPEQALGDELTEASDLFSFGIVLQELLTGRPVYPNEPLPFLIQSVADNESFPITGVDPDIARLVEDLKHPTPARRPTAIEALDRLRYILDTPQRVRRRRLKVAALTGAFALLTIVLAVVSFLAVKEKRARTRAEQLSADLDREARRANLEAATSNRVVDFLVDLFEQADPEQAQGREVSVKEIVERGGERISRTLSEDPLIQARLQDTLGGISWRLGDVEAAAKLLESALATEEKSRGGDAPAVAQVLEHLGAVYVDLERFDEARGALERAEQIFLATRPPPTGDLARTLNSLGALAWKEGDLEKAESAYRRSLELLRTQAKPPARDQALALNNLAILAWRRADYEAAEGYYRESLKLNEDLLGANHPHLAAQLNNMGILARDRGHYEESETLHRRALAIAESALGKDHPDVASILSSLARLYGREGRNDEGIALLRRALAIFTAAYGGQHAETATTALRLGDLLRRAGRLDEAEPRIVAARRALAAALGDDHPRLVEAWTAEGELRRAQHRAEAARQAFESAHRIGVVTLGAGHPEVEALARTLAALGGLGETAH